MVETEIAHIFNQFSKIILIKLNPLLFDKVPKTVLYFQSLYFIIKKGFIYKNVCRKLFKIALEIIFCFVIFTRLNKNSILKITVYYSYVIIKYSLLNTIFIYFFYILNTYYLIKIFNLT